MASTSLSSRGYSIPKASLSKEALDKIKSELLVSPYTPKGYDMGPKIVFPLFQESESRIYMPKCYGLEHYGVPGKNKVPAGLPLPTSLVFKGKLRSEQETPVANLLAACHDPKQMGGILNVFCGGGKTTMALAVSVALGRKTLIVVHKDFLLEQWKERIHQFVPGARVGLIKAKKVDVIDKDIVLGSLQSLCMKEYDHASTFAEFGTVVIDEVHHTSAEVFSRALAKVAFRYTIGLSATVQRKDGLTKVFLWHLGKIVYKAKERVDIVDVKLIEYDSCDPEYCDEPAIFNGKPNMSRMINNICAHKPRNERILSLIKTTFEEAPLRKLLILSDRRAHLAMLKDMIEKNTAFTTGIYLGGMKQTVLAECAEKQIILATFAIASEGYDQPGLDTLLLASPRSDIVQSAGRILRDRPEDRRNVPLIIDIVDGFSLFPNQGSKRMTYYKKGDWNIIYE